MSVIPNSAPRRSFNLGNAVAGFLLQPELPFSQILTQDRIARVFARHGGTFGRTYTTAIVLWAFMGQVLRDGKEAACQSAVSRILSFLQIAGDDEADPDTRDYCRARAKLPETALHELASDVAIEAEVQVDSKHLFKGRHAKLIDGSTFMMPDTIKNQIAYPQNTAQKPGIGFPIARIVVVLSLATACVIDVAIGKYKGKATGETALLRQLLDCFECRDIAVADRFYGNYWMIALLIARGVDVCFRKHQARRTDFRTGKRLGKNDHLVTWTRPKRPAWMSPEMYDTMPLEIVLREIRYIIDEPGRKQDPFVIVTTLYNCEQVKQEVTIDDIAELFGYRWNSELDIRSIKTHLNLHHLRCKSPEMVRREFWTTILAYNAIRTTAACSAALNNVSPRRISFVSTCQFVLSAWDMMASGLMAIEKVLGYCLSRLKQISNCLVGNRPGRFEPRVLKKRQKNYNLMMQPRGELKARLANGDNSFETK
ncbi:IS4 family transposase [Allorhodopirellula heiligendammensis]|uniref:Transposase DDE domain protein n=1 Tax=Allorhodopirellula heiligendammensis TaxID=2714739 RepID=A0A5C6BGA1_9BACT|nr:IS4 family transposase [Allorhodopirellula heiligendammensis]TWU11078.1 Transposase DDE domain protein [Allorhodopirellula heiligendammensis]